jgi:hypothetical protein
MPVFNVKSIPAEVRSSTKDDPEIAVFLKTGPVLGAHKPIHEQRLEHNAFIDKGPPTWVAVDSIREIRLRRMLGAFSPGRDLNRKTA